MRPTLRVAIDRLPKRLWLCFVVDSGLQAGFGIGGPAYALCALIASPSPQPQDVELSELQHDDNGFLRSGAGGSSQSP